MWAVAFDDFASEAEVRAILDVAHKKGFFRSRGRSFNRTSGRLESGLTPLRTSRNTFVQPRDYPHRTGHPIERFVAKVEAVTGIGRARHESMQVVRYERGEFYKTHHDSSVRVRGNHSWGLRVLTAFLYLSNVSRGGETHFPHLRLAPGGRRAARAVPGLKGTGRTLRVRPRQGTLVLWSNVLDSNPNQENKYARHEACAVLGDGVKYGANIWLTQYPTRRLGGALAKAAGQRAKAAGQRAETAGQRANTAGQRAKTAGQRLRSGAKTTDQGPKSSSAPTPTLTRWSRWRGDG